MLTAALIFLPLITSFAVFFVKSPQVRKVAFVGSLAELLLSVITAFLFTVDATPQFILDVPWITSAGIRFSVAIDGISLPLVLLTTFIVPLIIYSSFTRDVDKPNLFYGMILLMQMALVGVFVARDGFLFYLFWEVALIPIYFICLIWGGEGRQRITLKFFLYTLAGSLLMLVALVYLFFQTPDGSFSIESIYQAGRSLPAATQGIIFWAFFVAFGIKMPVFPFHTWQPDTYTTAPTQGTMLLSAIMLKMGIYGVLRWLIPVVPLGVQQWGMTAVVLSITGIVYASCIALVQKDLKRLIAYSSIAHVGLISAGLLTLSRIGIQGAMIQMLSHGIVVFALFFIVDVIAARTKTRNLTDLGGLRNVAPLLTSVFVVVMLGSVALPLTSGFIGEFLLINSIFQYRAILGAVAGLTTILGAVYMFRAFQQSMLGDVNSRTQRVDDLTYTEKAVLYPAVALIVLIGIFPAPLMAISEPAVSALLSSIQDLTAAAK